MNGPGVARCEHGIGERMLPVTPRSSPVERLVYSRHLFAYEQALECVAGKDTLEVGCGTAYGTRLLAERARSVQALDINEDLIRELGAEALANTTYRAYDGVRLPFPDGTFDVVLSFQVLEHVQDDRGFLSEIGRVLRAGGRSILTTPNRLVRLAPGQPPFNNFHVREYSPGELESAIATAGLEGNLRGVFGDPATQRMELRRLKKYRSWPYRHVFQRLPCSLQMRIKELLLRAPAGAERNSPPEFRWRLETKSHEGLREALDLWAEIRMRGEGA